MAQALALVGPSGVGKSTLVSALLKEHTQLRFIRSFTTRSIRPTELPGVHYFFVSKEEFERKASENALLERTQAFGNAYGTSRADYFDIVNCGCIPLLDIDTHGVTRLKSLPELSVEVVCLLPPSWGVLRERLTSRSTESPEAIEQRMQENKEHLRRIVELKGPQISYVVNYNYRLTALGLLPFLAKRFPHFKAGQWPS